LGAASEASVGANTREGPPRARIAPPLGAASEASVGANTREGPPRARIAPPRGAASGDLGVAVSVGVHMQEDLGFSTEDKLVIAACAISMLIVQMDWFALNLAIPAIARHFNVPATDLQWVVS